MRGCAKPIVVVLDCWHDGLGDPALRTLYQGATLLLLPLACAGAVNSILEALACRLPVVTTDVGGVPDYGGGTVYPIVAAGDDDAMVALVERYLAEPDWRQAVAARCRAFAVSTLAWPLVAAAHHDAYRALAAEDGAVAGVSPARPPEEA